MRLKEHLYVVCLPVSFVLPKSSLSYPEKISRQFYLMVKELWVAFGTTTTTTLFFNWSCCNITDGYRDHRSTVNTFQFLKYLPPSYSGSCRIERKLKVSLSYEKSKTGFSCFENELKNKTTWVDSVSILVPSGNRWTFRKSPWERNCR